MQACGRDLAVGGAVVAFASHHELPRDPGGQRRVFAAKGAGQIPPAPGGFGRTALDDLQHVHDRNSARTLAQWTSNLVNPARLTPGGPITPVLRAVHDCVEIRVRDEGIGIPAGLLSRIGQPVEQASNNPMLAREGTGLGLALVKALVAEHGGSFDVTSRENVGTEITVMLPRRQQPRASWAA